MHGCCYFRVPTHQAKPREGFRSVEVRNSEGSKYDALDTIHTIIHDTGLDLRHVYLRVVLEYEAHLESMC